MALNDSSSAKLNVTTYIFEFSTQKILLIAQIQNIGNTSIVVSPQDCLLNNTFYANTRVSFAPNSVQYGQFVFVAPGWNFTVP